jgi:hypothetical protein
MEITPQSKWKTDRSKRNGSGRKNDRTSKKFARQNGLNGVGSHAERSVPNIRDVHGDIICLDQKRIAEARD